MRGKKAVNATVNSIILLVMFAGIALADSIDKIQFIKIAPKDSKAVIKGTDGKLLVIKPGDAIGEGLTVKEIATGRIVLEEKTNNGTETVLVRMENGKFRLERMRKEPENRPRLLVPITNLQ